MLVECSNCGEVLTDRRAYRYLGFGGHVLWLCPRCKMVGDAKADGRVYMAVAKARNAKADGRTR